MAGLGSLTGRLALVTGAGGGIGRAVCQVFAREGARVAVVDVKESSADETSSLLQGGLHHSFQADVSSLSSVNGLLKKIASHFSMVPSVLVNCAGITRDKFLLKMDEKSFDDVISVNLKGSFLMTQATARLMVENKIRSGSIINVSSIVGKVGNLGQCNYAASKAGVIGLTKSAAKELALYGIRCNVILPGFIETPMTESVPDKVMDMVIKQTPLGRIGLPEEVAETCLFLASEKSSYITGTSFEVTGGFAM